jgi:hypothetical protein
LEEVLPGQAAGFPPWAWVFSADTFIASPNDSKHVVWLSKDSGEIIQVCLETFELLPEYPA